MVTIKEKQSTDAGLTPVQQLLNTLWDQHVRNGFITKDAGAALETMVLDAYVSHVPVMTSGVGRDQLKEFYAKHFIPSMPSDTEIVPMARTIGSDRLVAEMIIRFTHSIDIDWMLPGIAPTGKHVEWPYRREHAIAPHSLYYIVVEIVTVLSCTKGKFPPSEAKRSDFQAIFVAKCQFRMEEGKHIASNGVSPHVPSRRAKTWQLSRHVRIGQPLLVDEAQQCRSWCAAAARIGYR